MAIKTSSLKSGKSKIRLKPLTFFKSVGVLDAEIPDSVKSFITKYSGRTLTFRGLLTSNPREIFVESLSGWSIDIDAFEDYVYICKTNSGLGYKKFAYFFHTGDKLLCIDSDDLDMYPVGAFKALEEEDVILEPADDYDINRSPLVMFEFFKHYIELLKQHGCK